MLNCRDQSVFSFISNLRVKVEGWLDQQTLPVETEESITERNRKTQMGERERRVVKIQRGEENRDTEERRKGKDREDNRYSWSCETIGHGFA